MDFLGFMFGFQMLTFLACFGIKMYNVMHSSQVVVQVVGNEKQMDITKNFIIFIVGILAFGLGLMVTILASSQAVVEADTVYSFLFYGESAGLVLFFLFFFIELIFYIKSKAYGGIKAYGTK